MLIRIENSFEKFFKTYAKKMPEQTRAILKLLIYPRYYLELWNGYLGYKKYGQRYPQNSILIFGLPKSGTTWIEKMLASLPGFQSTMFPEMLYFGFKTGEGLEFDIPENFFATHKNELLVIKTHSYASDHNLNVIKKNNLKYVVMYRDIRDVAVSYVHFVQSRPWQHQYKKYANLYLEDGLVLGWLKVRDANAILISYEQMLANPNETFLRVCMHLGIVMTKQDVEQMVEKFKTSKDTREAIHFRKGEAGGWKKYFSDEIKMEYKKSIGNALIEMGYESDNSW